MKYTQEQLEARFGEASERIREVITSSEVAEEVDALRKKHGLHIDDASTLMDEVGYVLLGFTHPDQFVASLKKAINVPNNVAENIANEINEIIFKPIYTELVRPKEQEPDTGSPQPEPTPKREDVLREIEKEGGEEARQQKNETPNPDTLSKKINAETPDIPTDLPAQNAIDLAREKLEKSVSLPKETSRVDTSNQQPATDNQQVSPIEKKPYGGQDPYREPVNDSDLRQNR